MRYPGILPALTTPFAADGTVDAEALAGNAGALLDLGCTGLVATGTMAEAGSLDREERRTVVEIAVGVARGRVPVVAGVSAETPSACAGYARDAIAAGADAVMALPPTGYRADARELIAHYRALATAVEAPIVAYNNPGAAPIDMEPELLARLASKIPAIVAVKECSGDARRISELLARTDGDVEVLVGGDDVAFEGFLAGSTGWISGVAVVAPAECVELYELCRAGELAAARALYRRLLPLARLDMTPKLVQYFKAAIDVRGGIGGVARPPRQALDAEERARLEAALQTLEERSLTA